MEGTYHGASHCIVQQSSQNDLKCLACAVMSPTMHPRGRHGWRNFNTKLVTALVDLEENSSIGVRMYVHNREVPLDDNYIKFIDTHSYFSASQIIRN